MSHISKIFEEAPIKVQNRNGFDLSHVHSGTSKTGQLVPVLTKLLAPNTTISLGVQAEVKLPPLVAPFYGKVDFAIEGFIVPCSILYGGWKNFITNNDPSNFPYDQVALTPDATNPTVTTNQVVADFGKTGYALPTFPLSKVAYTNTANFRTLASTNDNIYDYMGINWKTWPIALDNVDFDITMLPGLAYHKICDVFYRNTKLTRTWFGINPNIGPGTGTTTLSAGAAGALNLNKKNVSMIWHSFYTQSTYGSADSQDIMDSNSIFDTANVLTFPDTTSFFSTRQRPYSRDYFTSAVASPQQGGASVLKFSVDVSTPGSEAGSFTINSLRMANSLQKFLETNNLSGEYADMMRNRWGVRPIDADFDEPHYLGRVVVPVYQHTINQTVQQDDNYVAAGSNSNYFTSSGILGAQAANAGTNAEGSICENFNVSCWSYLMCIASLIPHANYNFGLNRELTMTTLGDFPAPELQSVGMEEIKNYELWLDSGTSNGILKSTFGYIPRYSRFKYMDDRCSGELKPVGTLRQYQLTRGFSALPILGTDFVTIAQNALDSVLAVSTSTMNLSCWWEIYFKFKVVMPLADFCIPTLGDIQDTHTIKTTVGGSRL